MESINLKMIIKNSKLKNKVKKEIKDEINAELAESFESVNDELFKIHEKNEQLEKWLKELITSKGDWDLIESLMGRNGIKFNN